MTEAEQAMERALTEYLKHTQPVVVGDRIVWRWFDDDELQQR